MSTKRGKMVTYNEELLLIKLFNSTITWFCEVMWQISALYFYLLETNGYQTCKVSNRREGLPHINSYDSLSMCSWGATWQIKNISTITMLMVTRLIRVVTYHKERSFVWPLIEGIKWGHLTNQIHYISTCRRSIDINLLRCLLTIRGFLP